MTKGYRMTAERQVVRCDARASVTRGFEKSCVLSPIGNIAVCAQTPPNTQMSTQRTPPPVSLVSWSSAALTRGSPHGRQKASTMDRNSFKTISSHPDPEVGERGGDGGELITKVSPFDVSVHFVKEKKKGDTVISKQEISPQKRGIWNRIGKTGIAPANIENTAENCELFSGNKKAVSTVKSSKKKSACKEKTISIKALTTDAWLSTTKPEKAGKILATFVSPELKFLPVTSSIPCSSSFEQEVDDTKTYRRVDPPNQKLPRPRICKKAKPCSDFQVFENESDTVTIVEQQNPGESQKSDTKNSRPRKIIMIPTLEVIPEAIEESDDSHGILTPCQLKKTPEWDLIEIDPTYQDREDSAIVKEEESSKVPVIPQEKVPFLKSSKCSVIAFAIIFVICIILLIVMSANYENH